MCRASRLRGCEGPGAVGFYGYLAGAFLGDCADDGGFGDALLVELLEELIGGVGCDGDQEAAGGLGVVTDVGHVGVNVGVGDDVVAAGFFVAFYRAGQYALGDVVEHAGE